MFETDFKTRLKLITTVFKACLKLFSRNFYNSFQDMFKTVVKTEAQCGKNTHPIKGVLRYCKVPYLQSLYMWQP